MKLTKNSPEKEPVLLSTLALGDACWTSDIGLCIKTSYGLVNLLDGKPRCHPLDGKVNQVDVEVKWSKALND